MPRDGGHRRPCLLGILTYNQVLILGFTHPIYSVHTLQQYLWSQKGGDASLTMSPYTFDLPGAKHADCMLCGSQMQLLVTGDGAISGSYERLPRVGGREEVASA